MLKERLELSERRACRITGQHRSTQRHEPRRAAQSERVLETQRAHAELLVGDVPDGGKPGLERQPRCGEDRPRRHRGLLPAAGTAPQTARELPPPRRPTARTEEAARPAKAGEVIATGQLVREPGLKLAERPRVVHAADRMRCSHPAKVGLRPDEIEP